MVLTKSLLQSEILKANAIVESVHQVIRNIICTFELENNYLDEANPWKAILSATAFAVSLPFTLPSKALLDNWYSDVI
jgi:hypothetical protein